MSIIGILISNKHLIVSIVSKNNIIIHGSAPLRKQEFLGMPTMYSKPCCSDQDTELGAQSKQLGAPKYRAYRAEYQERYSQ